jgi:hypothetical protein
MAPRCAHEAVVLARRTVWRPAPGPQFCEWCQLRYDGAECPDCGRPADEDPVGQILVAFTTSDGRRWVVAAIRGADGRWQPERICAADAARDVFKVDA